LISNESIVTPFDLFSIDIAEELERERVIFDEVCGVEGVDGFGERKAEEVGRVIGSDCSSSSSLSSATGGVGDDDITWLILFASERSATGADFSSSSVQSDQREICFGPGSGSSTAGGESVSIGTCSVPSGK
jgi:hypothetical protein